MKNSFDPFEIVQMQFDRVAGLLELDKAVRMGGSLGMVEARGYDDFAKKNQLNMRDAAYAIAINRVAEACSYRGWV